MVRVLWYFKHVNTGVVMPEVVYSLLPCSAMQSSVLL